MQCFKQVFIGSFCLLLLTRDVSDSLQEILVFFLLLFEPLLSCQALIFLPKSLIKHTNITL